MGFRPEALGGPGAGAHAGEIDYRLARNATISEFRKGRLSRLDVCDAQTELMRAATNIGEPTSIDCPICEDATVVLVTYVFGARMPASGRAISSKAELTKLAKAATELAAYVVEVCPECRWNHLARSGTVGGRAPRR